MAALLIAFVLAIGVAEVSAAQATAVPPAKPPAAQQQKPPAPATGQAPAQTVVPPANQPLQVVPSDYLVGPQDVLNVTVFGEPQLSGKVRVDSDGSFPFQYLGRVKADGLTVAAIEATLKKGLADGYLRNPQVSVEMDQYRSQNVFVLGEVRSPNKYALAGNSTLMDALTMAGSVTPNAGHWVLIRHARAGVPAGVTGGPAAGTDDQRTADITVNLDDLQSGQTASVPLQDGDTIFVPKTERIYVNGFVRTPGGYAYEENMTVFTAIALAGGVTEKGSNTRISVKRLIKGEMKEVDVKQTDILKPGDQVYVKPRRL